MRLLGRNIAARRSQAPPLTSNQRWDLMIGRSCRAPAFRAEDERRAAWENHRDEMLASFQEKRPGQRPDAWWEYDAPEPREADQAAQLERLGLLTGDERAKLQELRAAAAAASRDR